MNIDAISKWLIKNKETIRITEVIGVTGLSPSITIRIESPNWMRVQSSSEVVSALGYVKQLEKEKAALLKPVGKRRRKKYVQEVARQAAQELV